MATRIDLARNLAAARQTCGFTQEGLAEAAGISRSTIIQIENGEADPQLSTVGAIASALSISPALLLFGANDMNAVNEIWQRRSIPKLKDSEVSHIEMLIRTHLESKRREAAALGSSAGIETGEFTASAGAKAGAAIGTLLLPGIGTMIGGLIGFALCAKRADLDKPLVR